MAEGLKTDVASLLSLSPTRDAGRDGAALPSAAPQAPRIQAIGRGGLDERSGTDLIAAASLVDGFSEQQELVDGKARHERPEGVLSSHLDLSRPSEHPSGGIFAKHRFDWAIG